VQFPPLLCEEWMRIAHLVDWISGESEPATLSVHFVGQTRSEELERIGSKKAAVALLSYCPRPVCISLAPMRLVAELSTVRLHASGHAKNGAVKAPLKAISQAIF